ncbi:MAG TPA: DUF3320 domain-containing protein [Parvularcula sp.]|nr:DUF3320 domain-containing protein [Parvularcula sp.]
MGANSVQSQKPEPQASGDRAIARLLEDARRRLVETGTRNRLVHVNRSAKRANVINVVNERSDDIFDILWANAKKMTFAPLLKDAETDPDAESEDPETPQLEFIQNEGDESRFRDNLLDVRMTPDGLQKRLLRLAREAQTAEGEQGVNVLYLALGFLTWFEDKTSAVQREAPLILLPVELKRNARTSTYDLVRRDDDLATNLPLKERLQEDFGIVLPDIEDEDGWRPSVYFDKVEAAIASRDRWSIDRDGMQLGFFSFSKFLMLRDLDPRNWANGGLATHALVRGLLREGFAGEAPLFEDGENLDTCLQPADIIQVIDADASQTKVIEEVRAGRNLIVQGPPGTGKSQTITNIIAAAAHDGKRVLFVAEKMAALSVVHDRLVKVGLRDICLELHSRGSNKKAVLDEFRRTLNSGAAVPAVPAPPDKLKNARDRLNEIARLIHQPIGETGETPFSVIVEQAKFAGAGSPPPSLSVDGLEKIDRLRANEIAAEIQTYAELLVREGQECDHPFRGVRNFSLQPTDLTRVCSDAEIFAAECERVAKQFGQVAAYLGWQAEPSFNGISALQKLLAKLREAPPVDPSFLYTFAATEQSEALFEAIKDGVKFQDAWRPIASQYAADALNADLDELFAAVAPGCKSLFARLGSKYRHASTGLGQLLTGALPKRAEDRLASIGALRHAQQLRGTLRERSALLEAAFKSHWRGENSAFKNALSVFHWLKGISELGLKFDFLKAAELASKPEQTAKLANYFANGQKALFAKLRKLAEALKLELKTAFTGEEAGCISLMAFAARFRELSAAQNRYDGWRRLQQSRAKLLEVQLGDLVAALGSGSLQSERAVTEFRYARAEAIWKGARRCSPELELIDGLDRHELVRQFQELDRQRLVDVKTLILAKHLASLPQGAVGQMGVIRGELGKQRGHKPIRKLVTQASEAVQRIKPVFLMSPISVAQFLPPGQIEFDLLVIDEASQVRPEDALGAVARCKQVVVVGDQKQLPPTAFFDRLTSNVENMDEDAEEDPLGGAAGATELESILSLCEARGLPARMLEWHYRSRDPSLITVSNAEFYDHGLILPPSPLQHDPSYGLKFTRVEGAYDRGGRRTNKIEAEALVKRVAEHAANNAHLSLGIVAFSSAQRTAIEELLEFERRRNPALDTLLREGKREDVFVKNIENVQGDERDVILISIGYGPFQPGGRLPSMSFGPVNWDGGERRLNVLFTRARLRCEVFASFDPGDIDLNRTTKTGPRVLKRYLQFAKTGILDEKAPTGCDADSPFEEDVAEVIRGRGYEVDHQVGSGGFRIDLGVRNPDRPGQYILAVECDGATYHSALWARERDRLRQGVLESLDWRFHRIWSTDWIYRRAAEVTRLRSALDAAGSRADTGAARKGANADCNGGAEGMPPETSADELAYGDVDVAPRRFPAYERLNETVGASVEPHEANIQLLADLVLRIVRMEGPIHQEEVARRVASSFGKERTGARISDAAVRALRAAKHSHGAELANDGVFWFTAQQAKSPPIRDRSLESGTLLKAEYIAPSEIAAALDIARHDSAGATEDELVRAAINLMGFKRSGPELTARFRDILYREISQSDDSVSAVHSTAASAASLT